jgi:hypothetical protein
MNEKLIEKKLKKGVEKKGGLSLKLTSPFFTGLPDRLNLMPGGIVRFTEIKTTGKDLEPRQEFVKNQLEGLGFKVAVLDDEKTLNDFLNDL